MISWSIASARSGTTPTGTGPCEYFFANELDCVHLTPAQSLDSKLGQMEISGVQESGLAGFKAVFLF